MLNRVLTSQEMLVTATETYNFVSFDDEFGTYNIGAYADMTGFTTGNSDDAGMDCAWMANEPLFQSALINGVYEFKGATMVLADDLTIDGWSYSRVTVNLRRCSQQPNFDHRQRWILDNED